MKSSRRETILEYLKSINGYVKGEDLKRIAGCTTQNVSYHIDMLRKDGVDIDVSRKGYRYKREVEVALGELRQNFEKKGILFEYIRACMDLGKVHSNNLQRSLYYTFNENKFFCRTKRSNLSFLINFMDNKIYLMEVLFLLSSYLQGEVICKRVTDSDYIIYEDIIFGRYRKDDLFEHFQFVLNDCETIRIDSYKIRPLSFIKGDYIGVKGFSLLIFNHLYVNL